MSAVANGAIGLYRTKEVKSRRTSATIARVDPQPGQGTPKVLANTHGT